MNFVRYRKFPKHLSFLTDWQFSVRSDSFLAQASVHGVQPERAGGEDQGGAVQKNPVPLLRGSELAARQNAELKGSKLLP